MRKQTKFQKMRILESPFCGRMLVLDDIVQTTELDEFIYHEMMTHVAMFCHGGCHRVLVVGGGDGGMLREVLRHSVEKAVQVEIDEEVVAACKKYLPGLSHGAYEDPRAHLVIADGARYVRETDERFDLVIVDSPDPVGPARVLFRAAFYRNVARVLRPGGLMVRQAGVPMLQARELKSALAAIRKVFPYVSVYLAPVPTYIGGFFAFAVGALSAAPLRASSKQIRERLRKSPVKTRYYSEAIHKACFALPGYIEEVVE